MGSMTVMKATFEDGRETQFQEMMQQLTLMQKTLADTLATPDPVPPGIASPEPTNAGPGGTAQAAAVGAATGGAATGGAGGRRPSPRAAVAVVTARPVASAPPEATLKVKPPASIATSSKD